MDDIQCPCFAYKEKDLNKKIMKKTWIFIGGVVTGVVLTFIFLFIIGSKKAVNDNYVMFEQDGKVISTNSFKVFQVLDSGDALANEIEEYDIPTGLTVLFLNDDGASHYDDQVIKVPAGKCVRQLGTYKYPTKSGFEKTVPIVGIRNK